MNRFDLQQLARERIADAEALLTMGRWSGAYYLAGYAVECGLKACIAKQVNQYDFPDKALALKAFTHRLEELIVLARLHLRRKDDALSSPGLEVNWEIVIQWDEASRYRLHPEQEARDLWLAVSNPLDGVFPWIMGHW